MQKALNISRIYSVIFLYKSRGYGKARVVYTQCTICVHSKPVPLQELFIHFSNKSLYPAIQNTLDQKFYIRINTLYAYKYIYTLRLLNNPDGCEDVTWTGSPLVWDTKLHRQLTVNRNSHSKTKWRCGRGATASVKTRNTRWHPGPCDRDRISASVRCTTQRTVSSSADALFMKSLSRKKKQKQKTKPTNNNAHPPKTQETKAKLLQLQIFLQDRCCSF